MNTAIKILTISITLYSYFFLFILCVCVCVCMCVVRGLKIYLLSKLQVYNTVLLITVTLLYIISPELIHLA